MKVPSQELGFSPNVKHRIFVINYAQFTSETSFSLQWQTALKLLLRRYNYPVNWVTGMNNNHNPLFYDNRIYSLWVLRQKLMCNVTEFQIEETWTFEYKEWNEHCCSILRQCLLVKVSLFIFRYALKWIIWTPVPMMQNTVRLFQISNSSYSRVIRG